MSFAKPWIGSNYSSGGINGNKILIVGEAAYKRGGYPEGYDRSNHTVSLAGGAIGLDENGGYWDKKKFYTRIARIFDIDPCSYEQRKALWSSVAYCNFIVEILTEPRGKLLPEHWELGKQAFLEVLRLTRPDIAICFSQRMWRHIPKLNDCVIKNRYRAYARSAVFALDDTHSVRLLSFKHPTSQGFDWRYVQEIIRMNVALSLDAFPMQADVAR